MRLDSLTADYVVPGVDDHEEKAPGNEVDAVEDDFVEVLMVVAVKQIREVRREGAQQLKKMYTGMFQEEAQA